MAEQGPGRLAWGDALLPAQEACPLPGSILSSLGRAPAGGFLVWFHSTSVFLPLLSVLPDPVVHHLSPAVCPSKHVFPCVSPGNPIASFGEYMYLVDKMDSR